MDLAREVRRGCAREISDDGADDDYDRPEDLVDDLDVDNLDAADTKVLRVLRSLVENADDRTFDVFDDEYAREMHIVVVGDDDYLDFPEDLARNITATP